MWYIFIHIKFNRCVKENSRDFYDKLMYTYMDLIRISTKLSIIGGATETAFA